MVRIYKYSIPIQDDFTLEIPESAQVLSVDVVDNQPRLWILVDPHEDFTTRRFVTVPTGEEFNGEGNFIGTYLLSGGALVFHLFEVD